MEDYELIQRALELMNPATYVHIDDPECWKILPHAQEFDNWVLIVSSIRSLSKDAIDIVELIMDPPEELSKLCAFKHNKKLTLGRISNYLRKKDPNRWKHSTIKDAFDVIRGVLCSVK